jgi:hypothetical protein
MADSNDQTERANESRIEALAAEDPRKPYEAPKLLKKRSVARATLFTVQGATMTGLTTMG